MIQAPWWAGRLVAGETDAYQARLTSFAGSKRVSLGQERAAEFILVLRGRVRIRFDAYEFSIRRREWISYQGDHLEIEALPGALVVVLTLPWETYDWLQIRSQPGFTIGRGRATSLWISAAQRLVRKRGEGKEVQPDGWMNVAHRDELFEHLAEMLFRGIDVGRVPGKSYRSKRHCLASLQRAWFCAEHNWARTEPRQLAKVAGMSTWYLSKVFRHVYGLELRLFLKRKRLMRAAELLVSADAYLVSEVGEAVGYKNAAAFTRAFTAFHGVAPSRMRAGSTAI